MDEQGRRKFKCPSCQEEIVVAFLKSGERAKCRRCGALATVPKNAVAAEEETPLPVGNVSAATRATAPVELTRGVEWRQAKWSVFAGGSLFVGLSLAILFLGWTRGSAVGQVAFFGLLATGAAFLVLGAVRATRVRTIRLTDSTISLLDSTPRELARAGIESIHQGSWVCRGFRSDSVVPGIETLISIAESGLSIRARDGENADTLLSLRGFPLAKILEALRSKGAEVPILALVQRTGSDPMTYLIFSESGVIGCASDADVTLTGNSTAQPKHVRWQIVARGSRKEVELTNLTQAGLKKGPFANPKQGEALTVEMGAGFLLGEHRYEFQMLSDLM